MFLEGPSIARHLDEFDEDYERYYVNLCVFATIIAYLHAPDSFHKFR